MWGCGEKHPNTGVFVGRPAPLGAPTHASHWRVEHRGGHCGAAVDEFVSRPNLVELSARFQDALLSSQVGTQNA